ncbi:MAG TPA: amidohydrolase family protein [Thermomonospora sp.]|nr:amidohydrolase family protein [Thermomonospora sp.]
MEDLDALPLIDHHCHGLVREDVDRAGFEGMLTEGSGAGPRGGTLFDSRIGFAVRRWCAPVLDLPAHAPPGDYLERRAELGHAEVAARFLRAARLAALCVDTGPSGPMLTPPELADLAEAPAFEVVRLEDLAEEVAGEGTTAAGFPDAFRERLAARAGDAVGFKSIAAYRFGLEFREGRPDDTEVERAAGRWLASGDGAGPPQLADETLHRFLVWCAADHGKPIQFHVAYGDTDLDLHRANPLLLTGLLRELEPTGTPVMLLHNYPYHREAGYLAQVFTHVFVDVGLAVHNSGERARALIEEVLELTPFGKFLYSSDGYGLPELYFLDATLFRRAVGALLRDGVEDGTWTDADAGRLAEMFTAGNARRAYRLDV